MEALAPLLEAADDTPLGFADRAVRELLPKGLEAAGLGAAAGAVRALPPLEDVDSVRRTMFALEKTARAHAAPELLIRAAHGTCACALSLGLLEARGPEAVERARAQLVSTLVRLATAAIKAGVPPLVAVRCLAGGEASGRPDGTQGETGAF